MLQSMTGYGKATANINNKKIIVETKSLNSKQLDIFLKIPPLYKSKELIIRTEIANLLKRGKVELSINVDASESDKGVTVNEDIMADYFEQLTKFSANWMPSNQNQNLLPIIMQMPEVYQNNKIKELDEDEWNAVLDCIKTAITDLQKFRKQEGVVLGKDVNHRIEKIETLLSQIPAYEKQRIEKIKERIKQNLNNYFNNTAIDSNRFEQELIYYLEKLDITEEKVRLKNHCNYFTETSKLNEPIGKKLGFIGQEIGREINTIGSKANDADLQKIVVQMKDELEKIKEQILNVL